MNSWWAGGLPFQYYQTRVSGKFMTQLKNRKEGGIFVGTVGALSE